MCSFDEQKRNHVRPKSKKKRGALVARLPKCAHANVRKTGGQRALVEIERLGAILACGKEMHRLQQSGGRLRSQHCAGCSSGRALQASGEAHRKTWRRELALLGCGHSLQISQRWRRPRARKVRIPRKPPRGVCRSAQGQARTTARHPISVGSDLSALGQRAARHRLIQQTHLRKPLGSRMKRVDSNHNQLASRKSSRLIMLLTSMSSMKHSMLMGACGLALSTFLVFSQATKSRYIACIRANSRMDGECAARVRGACVVPGACSRVGYGVWQITFLFVRASIPCFSFHSAAKRSPRSMSKSRPPKWRSDAVDNTVNLPLMKDIMLTVVSMAPISTKATCVVLSAGMSVL